MLGTGMTSTKTARCYGLSRWFASYSQVPVQAAMSGPVVAGSTRRALALTAAVVCGLCLAPVAQASGGEIAAVISPGGGLTTAPIPGGNNQSSVTVPAGSGQRTAYLTMTPYVAADTTGF